MEPKSVQNGRRVVNIAVSEGVGQATKELTLRDPKVIREGTWGRQVRRLRIRKEQSSLRIPVCRHVVEGLSESGCQRPSAGCQ